MKHFRLNALALTVAATFALSACSSNSSDVTGGTKTAATQTSNSGTNATQSPSSTTTSRPTTNTTASTPSNTSNTPSSTTPTAPSTPTNTAPVADNTTSTPAPTASQTNDNASLLKDKIAAGFGDGSGIATAEHPEPNANGEYVIRYAADVVSINKDGSITHQKINDDKRGVQSKSFTLNNTRIDLLNDVNENKSTAGGIPVRQMRENDFTAVVNGNISPSTPINPLHATNPSWVGSVAEGTIERWGEESNNTGSFRNLRYGVYNDADGNSHLFVLGLPSAPFGLSQRTGKIEYAGSAIVGKDGKYEGLANAMKATADFDNKKVAIEIERGNKLSFGGDMKGNTFEGTQNGIYTKGGFYGFINATSTNSNLGGMFSVIEGAEKGLNGVYGGAQK